MMALAGIIGPGLLVGSGGALASGGPASAHHRLRCHRDHRLQHHAKPRRDDHAISVWRRLHRAGRPLRGSCLRGSRRVQLLHHLVCLPRHVQRRSMESDLPLTRFAVLANEYNTISSIMVFWSDKVPVWGYFLIFWVRRRIPASSSLATDTNTPCHTVCLPRLPASQASKHSARLSSGSLSSSSAAWSPTSYSRLSTSEVGFTGSLASAASIGTIPVPSPMASVAWLPSSFSARPSTPASSPSR